MNNSTSLVIQGPLHNRSIDAIHHYRNFFDEIIYSCWTSDPLEKLPKEIVVVASPPISDGSYDRGRIQSQAITSLAGLRHSTNVYSLKIRSDEYFQDLTPLVESAKQNHGKLACTNAFYKSDANYPCHIGDHAVCSTTRNLSEMYSRIISFCKRHKDREDAIPGSEAGYPDFNVMVTESIMFCKFLEHYGAKFDPNAWRDQMRDHTTLVPVSRLGNFIVRSNNANRDFTTEDELVEMGAIRSLDEL